MLARSEYGIVALGFLLAVVGFVTILYEIWVNSTIPLNNITFTGMGFAGAGIAIGAIGLDRGIEVRRR
jgi:hypothetical protein